MKIRIGTANTYVNNSNIAEGLRRLNRRILPWLRPDALGLQETSKYNAKLDDNTGYKAFYQNSDNAYVRSNSIVVNKDLAIQKFNYWPAVPGVKNVDGRYGVTPPRNIVGVRFYKRGKKIAVINSHLHVIQEEVLQTTPESRWPVAAKQYKEHVLELIRIANEFRSQGYIVFITADGNTRPQAGALDWAYSLYNILPRYGWKVIRNGVDVVAYDGRKVKEDGVKIIPNYVFGSDDHAAIIARFETL